METIDLESSKELGNNELNQLVVGKFKNWKREGRKKKEVSNKRGPLL